MKARTPRRGLGLFGDVLASGVLVAASAVVNLLAVMVFARTLDPAAFGLFATCRRVVAFAAPLASLGTHLGVSRYLGFYASERPHRDAVLSVAFVVTAGVALTTAIAFGLLHRFGARIEWVATLERSVWLGTIALTIATAAGLVVFSVLRGLGKPRFANLHQFTTLAAVLVIGVAWREAGVARLLLACAATGAAVNAAGLLWVFRRHPPARGAWSPSALRGVARQIMPYSVARIGDGPLQASLGLVGIVAAPAIGGLTLAGYIHISQTIVRVTEIAVVPLSVIFLPVVARYVREGRFDALRSQAQLVYDSIVLLGACGVAHGIAWGPSILDAAFGSKYSGALPYLLCSLPSILPFLLFAGFRSFIDGYATRPVNTLHLLAASAFIVVATRFGGGLFGGLGLCLAYTCGVMLLGLLTMRFARREFGLRSLGRATVLSTVIAAASGLLGWSAARLVHGAPAVAVFGVFAAVELGLAAGCAWFAWRFRHPVATYAMQRLRDRARTPALESGQPVCEGGSERAMASGTGAREPEPAGARAGVPD